MPNTLNLTFLQSASGKFTSDVFDNYHYSLAVLQVTGSFTGAVIVVEGRVQVSDGPWVALGAWDTRDFTTEINEITSSGIYEVPIDGVTQLRLRIASLAGGSVTVSGVLYDSSDNSTLPDGSSSIRFGDPDLFVKGIAEQIYMDPSTGNIIGYDRDAASSAVQMSVNFAQITGGMGNRLIGVLPDTVRVSGAYTSDAFSLRTREMIMGGQLAYNAVVPVCEKVTAASDVLTVSGNPVHSLAQSSEDALCWCYVVETGGKRKRGSNYGIDPVSKEVQNFYAEVGAEYEVTYYTHSISAQMLPAPSHWNPIVMTVQTRYAVYGKQGKNEKRGVLRGWLYFIVPRAILNANAGLTASQTATDETDGSWIALTNKRENMPYCDCSGDVSPIAYYVYVPCGDETQKVADIIISGGGLALAVGKSEKIPVKLVMDDDTLVQPDFSRLNYSSENESVATIDSDGMVMGVSAGTTRVHAYIARANGASLDASCPVTVTGNRSAIRANPENVTII